MKYFPILLAMCLLPLFGNAQIQKFDKVGIGITLPVNPLHITSTTEATVGNIDTYNVNISQAGSTLGLGGNASYSFLQSFNAKPLQINLAGNNTLLNAAGLGRVGVGTNAPAALLDVNGDFRLGVDRGGTAYSIGFTRTGNAQVYSTNPAGLTLGGDANGIDAVILPNGNVGIGTTNPGHKLDIPDGSVNIGAGANTAYRAGNYLSMGNMRYTNAPYIAFNAVLTTSDIATSQNLFTPAYNAGGGLIIRGEAGTSGLHIYQKEYNNGTPPYDLYSFTEVFTITRDGKIGIGTALPRSHRLAVEGSIGARKVKVTQEDWADFVFHPDYQLASLYEIERYIKANRHLPEIPSAEEVRTNGLDLGEMNKQLLQKIEELTLYLIDMKKEIDQLKAQDKMLTDQIQKIR